MAFCRQCYPTIVLACLLLLSSCGLPPTAIFSVGPTAAYPVTTYTSVGDSITYGYSLDSPSTQAYPALLADVRHWTLNNYALPGDMACDVFPRQILKGRVAFSSSPGPVYSLMIGTNDADWRGTGAYESIFSNCELAAITWLGTRPEDKLLPGDASVTASGACTSVLNTAFTCSGTGSLDFGSIPTTGTPLYLWYTVSDTALSTDNFTVTIDGNRTTVSIKSSVAMATTNGSSSSVYLLRVPLQSGSHRVQLSTSANNVSVLSLASNRASNPIVVGVGDIPNQLNYNPAAPLATQLTYVQLSRQNIAIAASDGLDIRAVNDRDYMLATSAEMHDSVHPNVLGQARLAVAFSTKLP